MKEWVKNAFEKFDLVSEIRKTKIVKLWEKGLETTDCIGYHCTTLEAIQYSINHNGIPGRTGNSDPDPTLPQIGDIYFLPRLLTFPFEKLPDLLAMGRIDRSEEEFALREAEMTADSTAMAHKLCSFLKLDISIYGNAAENYLEDLDRERKSLDYFEAERALTGLKLDKKLISQAVDAARKRKGVIIGLKRSALELYPLSEGDAGNDFRLSTGKEGLILNALSGIKSLGPEETLYFQNLKNGRKL
jgi:hypothetical protein